MMTNSDNRETVHLKIARLLQEQSTALSQEMLFTIAHNYSIFYVSYTPRP